MATKKQVVVIAQDPEDPDNSPDVFTTNKKSIMGMSIAMIVLGVLSVVLEVNFRHSHIFTRCLADGGLAFCHNITSACRYYSKFQSAVCSV